MECDWDCINPRCHNPTWDNEESPPVKVLVLGNVFCMIKMGSKRSLIAAALALRNVRR